MKNIFLLLILILLMGCRKEGLDLKFRTIYTSSANKNEDSKKGGMVKNAIPEYYAHFGDFVGTITPKKVTANFNTIRYIDRKNTSPGMQTMMEIVSVNWPFDDERRFADFTNGNTLEVVPEIWGNIDNDGWFVDENITLKYLAIIPNSFNFEYDLPDQFTGVERVPANYVREGNTIKCDMHHLLMQIRTEGIDYVHGIRLNGFVFGETDTSYIASQNNIPEGDIIEFISMALPNSVVRSGNYTCPVLTPPARGKSKIITTTVSFDSQDLIQQYSGWDNIPYTFDDVFVMEPKFWDRFNIRIDQN